MARELARLKLKIEGDTKGLRSSLKGAEDQAKRSGARMRRAFRRASGAVGRLSRRVFSLRGALIGLAGAVALGAAIKRAIDFADSIGKTAKAAGISAEKLQVLRFAARRSGVEVGQLDKAIIKFNKTVAEAKTRVSSEFALTLRDVNQELVQGVIATSNQEQAFDLLADATADAATEAEKVAIASAAFGTRVGPKMVLVLRDGTDGMRKFEAAARRLGIVLSNETIAKAEIAADELGDLGDVFKIIATRAALEATPALRQLAKTFTDPEFLAAVKTISGEIVFLVDFIARHQREIKATFAAIFTLGVASRLGIPPLLRFGLAALAGGAAFAALGDEVDDTNRRIRQLQTNLERLRSMKRGGEEFVAGPTVAEQIAKDEAELAGLQARLAEINKELARAQVEAPLPIIEVGDVETFVKLTAALRDIDFEIRKLRGDFDELAPGTAEAARQIGLFDDSMVRGKVSVENLSENVKKLNDSYEKLAALKAAKKIEETAAAAKKLALSTNKVSDAAQEMGTVISTAFEDAVLSGEKFSDVLLSLEQTILRILFRTAITGPLETIFKTVFESIGKGLSSAKGNVIAGGRVVPMQRGGIIGGPVAFPLRGGIGVAGETAPEAILPLKRLPSGDLGVGAVRPGAVNITIVNNTGGAAEVRQRPGPRGGMDIEITLDRAVSRLIRGGGLTMTAIQDTFITAVRPIGR